MPGDYYGNSINVASKLGDDTAGPGEFLIEEDAQIEEDLKKRMERAGFRFRKTTVANQGRPVGSSNSLAGTCSKDSRCITMADPQPLRIFTRSRPASWATPQVMISGVTIYCMVLDDPGNLRQGR